MLVLMKGVKKMGIFSEFKTFIAKGNVVDMAVGVVVGAAFKAIVDSLVSDIISPVIGLFTGKVNLSLLSLKLSDELIITYGNFIQNIINFLIVAFTIFCVVKGMNTLKAKFEKKEEAEEAVAEPSAEEALLTEIRDLLKQGK